MISIFVCIYSGHFDMYNKAIETRSMHSDVSQQRSVEYLETFSHLELCTLPVCLSDRMGSQGLFVAKKGIKVLT